MSAKNKTIGKKVHRKELLQYLTGCLSPLFPQLNLLLAAKRNCIGPQMWHNSNRMGSVASNGWKERQEHITDPSKASFLISKINRPVSSDPSSKMPTTASQPPTRHRAGSRSQCWSAWLPNGRRERLLPLAKRKPATPVLHAPQWSAILLQSPRCVLLCCFVLVEEAERALVAALAGKRVQHGGVRVNVERRRDRMSVV